MDTLSHGLWALAIFWGTSYRWWAFLIGIAPDLLSFGLFFFIRVADHASLRGPPAVESLPGWLFTSYDITHSFVTWAVIGAVLYFLGKKYWPIVGAAMAHIALDIPTHCSYFPTPYLWPIPHMKFCGVNWSHPTVFAINWLALLAIFILIGVHEWQKKKSPGATEDYKGKNSRGEAVKTRKRAKNLKKTGGSR